MIQVSYFFYNNKCVLSSLIKLAKKICTLLHFWQSHLIISGRCAKNNIQEFMKNFTGWVINIVNSCFCALNSPLLPYKKEWDSTSQLTLEALFCSVTTEEKWQLMIDHSFAWNILSGKGISLRKIFMFQY